MQMCVSLVKTKQHFEEGATSVGKRAESCITLLATVLLFYVLSTGPVVRLACEDKIPFEMIETVYVPLKCLDGTEVGGKILKPFFHWYGEKVWGWHLDLTY